MKLVTFEWEGIARPGVMLEQGVLDIVAAGAPYPDMQSIIEGGENALERLAGLVASARAEHFLKDVRLLAPLPRPVRLRDCCLFLEHMEVALAKLAREMADRSANPVSSYKELLASGRFEVKDEFRRQPIYYNASHLHIIGPDEDLIWPESSSEADYELEWACIVGKTGKGIPVAEAASHIFGYTIFNDWSARDLQKAFMDCNLGPGGGKDFANGLGPCIVTRDEIGDPYALEMVARVNGVEWSRGSTASMHHRFEDAIVALSADRTLYAGEVIGSGTVLSGCGYELGRKLASGDLVELEIQPIGILANRVVIPALQSGEQ